MKTETTASGKAPMTLGEAIDLLQSILDNPSHSRGDAFAMSAFKTREWWVSVTAETEEAIARRREIHETEPTEESST